MRRSISLSYGVTTSDWRTGCIANLQCLSDFQTIRRGNVITLREVTEIVPGDPRDIKQRITTFNGVGTAAGVAAFRNIAILAVIDDMAVHRLNGLLCDGLDLRRLNGRTLYRLNLRLLRGRAKFWRRRD